MRRVLRQHEHWTIGRTVPQFFDELLHSYRSLADKQHMKDRARMVSGQRSPRVHSGLLLFVKHLVGEARETKLVDVPHITLDCTITGMP